MTTLNTSLWWLLLLGLVPILIHILIRQRVPVVPWAAQTFLLKALRKNRRKLLLETILLLIVRTAIVVMIVLVVVRPVAQAAWAWLGSHQQRTLSVIVLDDSASMAATDGVSSRFQRALTRVEEYLDELPGASEVAVVLAADPSTDLIRLPTRDLAFVRDALARLEPRDSTSALAEAIERTTSWLADAEAPNREIILVTDAQAADLEQQKSELQQAVHAADRQAAVFVMTVPKTPLANVAVTDIAVTGGPEALIPGFATTLWPSAVQVSVIAPHHPDPVETVVELFVDGDKVARRDVTLTPDRTTTVKLEHRFIAPGEHAITARCRPDLFDRDDERSLVVDVHDRVPVLMVDGRPADDPFATATGFLRVAIWPTSPDDPAGTSPLDVQTVPASGLDSVRLNDYPLIVLADVPALAPAVLERVQTAVQRGAGLWIIAGEQTTAAGLASMFADPDTGLMPVAFAPAIDLAPDAAPIGLTLAEPLVPVLAPFEDPALSEALSRAGWHTLQPVAETLGTAQAWASFDRGGAALISHGYGRGQVIYFGGSLDRRGGDFPLSPAFVPFVQQLGFFLLEGGTRDSVIAGDRLVWPVAGSGATLVHPDNTSEPADTMTAEDTATGEPRVVLDATDRAGIYTLRATGRDDVPRDYRRAVVVPEVESDLATLPADELADDWLPESARLIGPERAVPEAVADARTRAELWPLGLMLLIALIATELLLVRLFAPKQIDADGMLERAMRL